jgi:hypothetical protein
MVQVHDPFAASDLGSDRFDVGDRGVDRLLIVCVDWVINLYFYDKKRYNDHVIQMKEGDRIWDLYR